MADTLKVDGVAGDAALGADDPAARVGSVVAGKYALHRLLGVGGMGAVYEAENTWTGRRVALKVMLPAALRQATAPERFLREARAASKVQHPNIVEVFDAGQSPADGALYIVQELLKGTDLRALLDTQPTLSWREAWALIGPVVEALAAAHRQGVVHRDVKPENIYLADTPAGRVPKLIDFGIARLVDAPINLTGSGALMGTPYYMSPEQARGLRDIDARADVWALGVVLREALTGRRPFAGDNYNAVMVAILQSDLAPTADVTRDVPAHAAAAVDRALARDPSQRFRDAAELLDALRAAASDSLAQTAPGVTVPLRVRHRKRALGAMFVAGACVASLVALSLPRARPTARPAVVAAPLAALAAPAAPPVLDAAVTPPVAAPPAVVAPPAPPLPAAPARSRPLRRVRRPVGAPATPLIRSLHAQ
jgi:serine/threonine protein kinase